MLLKGRIKTAAEARRHFQLGEDQLVALILFDHDPYLERLFSEEAIRQLAEGKYDLIASPSYSIWWPRPRLHQLINMSRSLAFCVALQELGAPAIPRIDWAIDHDIERWADWLKVNSCVDLVAIDAQTSKQHRSWDQLMSGLITLDARTGRRLRYLINGPATESRWAELYKAVDVDRITVTDARLHMGEPPSAEEQLQFARADGKVDWGLCYPARVLRRERDIDTVRRNAA